jgi:hypothetical protein
MIAKRARSGTATVPVASCNVRYALAGARAGETPTRPGRAIPGVVSLDIR